MLSLSQVITVRPETKDQLRLHNRSKAHSGLPQPSAAIRDSHRQHRNLHRNNNPNLLPSSSNSSNHSRRNLPSISNNNSSSSSSRDPFINSRHLPLHNHLIYLPSPTLKFKIKSPCSNEIQLYHSQDKRNRRHHLKLKPKPKLKPMHKPMHKFRHKLRHKLRHKPRHKLKHKLRHKLSPKLSPKLSHKLV